jgi:hypothetical protein
VFPVFEMSGGLIEHQPAPDTLFDHEEARVAHHDRGDGDLRIPFHEAEG